MLRRRLNLGLRLNSDSLVHLGIFGGFLTVGVVAVVVVVVTVMTMMVLIVVAMVMVMVAMGVPEIGVHGAKSCLIACSETLIKANLKYLLFLEFAVVTVVAFIMVVVTVAFAVVVMVVVLAVVAFILMIFFTRFISFIFVLVLVAIGLGLFGSARHSGYRNVRRSITGSGIRAASSSSGHEGGLLRHCTPDQLAVKTK